MKKQKKFISSRMLGNILPAIVLVAVAVLFGVLTKGRFLSSASIKTIFNQAIITGIVATGAVFIFASGNVNIALGGTTALSAIVGALVWNATRSVALMMVACIVTGVLILLVSCALSVVFKIKIISVTMIMMGLLTALQQWIMMHLITVGVEYKVVSSLTAAGVPVILLVVSMIIFTYLFCFTKIGRSLKMMGENNNCAIQTGINLNKYITIAFIVTGVGAGIGAILLILRSGSISATTANSLNMDVMLAIVLGGMPVTGGYKSKITAGIFGAFLVTMLNSGLLMIGVNAMIVQAVRGICFLLLIIFSSKRPSTLPVKEMA